jgi:hypothetical protein
VASGRSSPRDRRAAPHYLTIGDRPRRYRERARRRHRTCCRIRCYRLAARANKRRRSRDQLRAAMLRGDMPRPSHRWWSSRLGDPTLMRDVRSRRMRF